MGGNKRLSKKRERQFADSVVFPKWIVAAALMLIAAVIAVEVRDEQTGGIHARRLMAYFYAGLVLLAVIGIGASSSNRKR